MLAWLQVRTSGELSARAAPAGVCHDGKHAATVVQEVEMGVFDCPKCHNLTVSTYRTSAGTLLTTVICHTASCHAPIDVRTQRSEFYQCRQAFVCVACKSALRYTMEKVPPPACRCARCANLPANSPEKARWKPTDCLKLQESPSPTRLVTNLAVTTQASSASRCARRLNYGS